MLRKLTISAALAALAVAPATASAIGTSQGAYGCANGQSGPTVGYWPASQAAESGQTVCVFALKNIDSTVTINVLTQSYMTQPGLVEIAADGGAFEPKGEGFAAVGFTLPAIQPGFHTWTVRTTVNGEPFVATASMTTIADDPTRNDTNAVVPEGAIVATNDTMIAAGLMPTTAVTRASMSAETAAVVASLLEVAPAIFAATPEPVAAAPVAGWCATICAA